MLDMKKLLAKILSSPFIVEEGTSNSWNYRKWSDGTYEAWRSVHYTGLAITASSAGTYYHTTANTIAYPAFSTSCTMAVGQPGSTSMSSGLWLYRLERFSASLGISFRAHASSSNAQCGADLYIRGTW